MKSHEIFQRMSPELAKEILTFLQGEDKQAYKAAIQGLANQRKLRPVFVERKPPNERFPWIQAALGRSASEMLSSHLLQAWLLSAHKNMLCDFLDALGIAHEADGTVEEISVSPEKAQISAAVENLLAKYPAETVAVYLHAFRDMDSEVQWPALDEILQEERRLHFNNATAT